MIDACLDRLGLSALRLHHGEGDATWPELWQAASLGRDTCIGLEDTCFLPDRALAPSNVAVVVAAGIAASL